MNCPFCHVEHRVLVPTVHLNGTPGESLRDELQEALDAVRNASGRLVAASPNGRDYYPQEAGATVRVQEQHGARLRHLDNVRLELEEMLEHVVAVLDYQAAGRTR